jgi:CheY-like chemotaxis protein
MVVERSSPSSAERALRGTTSRSVLILEDDRDVAQTLKDVIEEQGYRAVCVGNGREALAFLEEEQACFMLIDVFMPIMNGVEFLKVVKSNPRLAKIPRVIMTAANDRMIGVKEDVSVLYKPVDFDGLKRLLQKYCDPVIAPAPRS